MYIEERFPQFGVRYIAINDGVDTDSAESNDLMPFKNLFNEWYVRDSSRKVRAVLKAKAERGERLGNRSPYGYIANPDRKGRLVVDEEAAAVVKHIFALCAGGMGPTKIANQLRKDNVYTPSVYMYKKYGISGFGINLDDPYNWCADTISKMLENEVYLGHTVSMRYSSKSYKDKRKIEHPREECIVTENTHQPIISPETWDVVRSVRKDKRRYTRFDEKSIFSGLLYCADCGRKLDSSRGHNMKPSQYNFRCRCYKKNGSKVCTPHYIRECVLEDVVLEDIRIVTHAAREHPEEFAEYIGQKQMAEQQRVIRTLEHAVSSLRKRKNELNTIFRKLYEDSVLNRITTEQFQMLSSGYTDEQAEIEKQLAKKSEVLEQKKTAISDIGNFVSKAKQYTDIQELSTELLHLFIEKIVVHEKEQKYCKNSPQTLEIHYKDIGCLDMR